MKRTISITLFLLLALTSAAFSGSQQKVRIPPRDLVLYYSVTGNTQTAARALADKLHADIVRVEDVEQPLLTTLYDEKAFYKLKRRPWKLKPLEADLSKYTRVFIGTPVWRGLESPAIDAFIEQADLTDKKIVLFVTMMENDPEQAIRSMAIKVAQRGGKVESSFSINVYRLNSEEITAKVIDMAASY